MVPRLRGRLRRARKMAMAGCGGSGRAGSVLHHAHHLQASARTSRAGARAGSARHVAAPRARVSLTSRITAYSMAPTRTHRAAALPEKGASPTSTARMQTQATAPSALSSAFSPRSSMRQWSPHHRQLDVGVVCACFALCDVSRNAVRHTCSPRPGLRGRPATQRAEFHHK